MRCDERWGLEQPDSTSRLVRAYDAFLSDPDGKAGVYNVGWSLDNTTSLLEFLYLLEQKARHRTDGTFDEWREGDQKVYVSDVSRAEDELDWTPEVGFEEGIERFVEWYENRWHSPAPESTGGVVQPSPLHNGRLFAPKDKQRPGGSDDGYPLRAPCDEAFTRATIS